MWRPGFEFLSAKPARLDGYHRRLAVFSNHYRGTDEKPGLVVGLDIGGSCFGVIYEIAAPRWNDTITYVRGRELLGDVYAEQRLRFSVLENSKAVEAITYVVRHESKQYVPPLTVEELLPYINQGHGTMGSCRDYVANTITHLRQLGIHDADLERFAPHVMV